MSESPSSWIVAAPAPPTPPRDPVGVLARWLMRPSGIAQVVLGALFWSGHALTLVRAHMAIGLLFVLSLEGIALLALRARARTGLAVATALWGILVLAFGLLHGRLLPGPLHWVVRLAHLAIGMAAMALANRLAAHRQEPALPAGTAAPSRG